MSTAERSRNTEQSERSAAKRLGDLRGIRTELTMGGRRGRRAKVITISKRSNSVATVFNCPFCDANESVVVKMYAWLTAPASMAARVSLTCLIEFFSFAGFTTRRELTKSGDVGTATLQCNQCKFKPWTTDVNYLSEPIDVFAQFLDYCSAANDQGAGSSAAPAAPAAAAAAAGAAAARPADDDAASVADD